MILPSERIFELTESQKILQIFEEIENPLDISNQLKKIYMDDLSILNHMKIAPLNLTLFHYFVYSENRNCLLKLLKIAKLNDISLDLIPDVFNMTPLDIAISTQNRTFTSSIVNYCISKPQKINSFCNFSENFLKLVQMDIPRINELLDSRLISIEPLYEIYSDSISGNQTKSFDTYLITQEEYEQIMNLENKETIKNSLCEFLILDMPNALSIENNILQHIKELSSEHPIFESEVVEIIIQHKWNNYAYMFTILFLILSIKIYSFFIGIM